MELDNVTWRNLKSIYLTIPAIKKLVDDSFVAGTGSKEAYITSYEARHFLRRLVIRAFKEMIHARKVRDIVLDWSVGGSGWGGESHPVRCHHCKNYAVDVSLPCGYCKQVP